MDFFHFTFISFLKNLVLLHFYFTYTGKEFQGLFFMESYDFFVVYKLCTTRHFLCSFYKRAIYKYSAAMYNKFQDCPYYQQGAEYLVMRRQM